MFLAGRTLADLPGSWQAQTSLQAEPLAGDKAQTRNLDGDRLAALQVSNTGSQPLWLRLDSSGYPQSAPQPGGNVRGLNALFSIPGAAEIAVFTAQRRTGARQAGGDRQTQRA